MAFRFPAPESILHGKSRDNCFPFDDLFLAAGNIVGIESYSVGAKARRGTKPGKGFGASKARSGDSDKELNGMWIWCPWILPGQPASVSQNRCVMDIIRPDIAAFAATNMVSPTMEFAQATTTAESTTDSEFLSSMMS